MYSLAVGKLVCSVNMLCMEQVTLVHLVESTRASEHVIVQINFACNTTDSFFNCFLFIWKFI